MRVIIQPDYQRISKWTANYIADRINSFEPNENRKFVLGLPTGGTPVGTYRELVEIHRQGKLSFRNVVTFNMDEYVGIPGDPPEYRHIRPY